MSKIPIYACLFLILLITSFILYMYSETKKSSSTPDTNSNLHNYGMYTCFSTISIMVFICSIMVMLYQITCYADNNLNLFNNNDDSYDSYDDNDDYDDYDNEY